MALLRDDKLEASLEHDKAKIRKAEMFRRCLTAHGFERYVASFYQSVEGIEVDVRSGFASAPVDAAGKYWKNGEKATILVLSRHGGGATAEDGRRFVEKPEVEEFFNLVSHVRKEAGHAVHLICVTSVWFSKEARDFCESRRLAAIDFSGLVKMDQAYPLENFIRECAANGTLSQCFSTFWLGKYLPEYAKTEAAVKRTVLDSKSALGSLLIDVEKTVSATYINPFDTAPEKIESFATIFDVAPAPTPKEPERPPTIFDAPEVTGKINFKAAAVGFAAVCACVWLVTAGSQPSSAPKISASAIEAGNSSTGSLTGSEDGDKKANSASERRKEVREKREEISEY